MKLRACLLAAALLAAVSPAAGDWLDFGDIPSNNTDIRLESDTTVWDLSAILVDSDRTDAMKVTLSDGTTVLTVDTQTPGITLGANTVPRADSTYDLGSTAVRWANIWTDSITATGGSITGITDLAVADGGTGASDAATARTNLGLVISTNVQAWDAQLDDLAGLAVIDGNFAVGDGTNWVAENGATARTSLGLGTIATQEANSVSISGGTITGITDLAVADGGTGSSTGSITGTAALTFTAGGTDTNITLTPNGTGSVIASADVLPSADSSHDLGATGTRWLNVWADNITATGGTITGITDLAVADGGTGTSSGSITGTGALTFTSGGSDTDITLTPNGSGSVIASADILPSADSSHDLGVTGTRWANVWADNITATGGTITGITDLAVADGGTGTSTGSITGTGALTFTAGGSNTDVTLTPNGSGSVVFSASALPAADSTQDLGTTLIRWANVWADNITATGGTITGITDLAVADGGTGTSTGSITGTGALVFTAGGSDTDITLTPNGSGTVVASASVLPSADSSHDLGSTSVRWANVWSDNVTATGGTITGITDLAVADGGTGTSTGSITGTGALAFTAGGTAQNVSLAPSTTGVIRLDGGVVINEDSADIDFRIESDANENMVVVDGGASTMAIGGAITANGHLLAGTDSAYDIGSTGTRWLNVWTDNITATGGTITGITDLAVADGGTGTSSGSITGTGALVFTAGGTDTDITLTPNGSGSVIVSANLLPSADSTLSLGVTGTRWASIWTDSITATGGTITGITDLAVADGGTGTSTGSITGTGALTFTAGGSAQNVSLVPSTTGVIRLDGGVVVNEDSADVDFRIESNDNDQALVVDGGTNVVCIGNAVQETWYSLYSPLQIGGTSAISSLTTTAGAGPLVLHQNSYYAPGPLMRYRLAAAAGNLIMSGGEMVFEAAAAGIADDPVTAYDIMTLGLDEVCFNEESQDINFRVESDGDASMFVIDAGAETIGMGGNTTLDGTFTISENYGSIYLGGTALRIREYIDSTHFGFYVNTGANPIALIGTEFAFDAKLGGLPLRVANAVAYKSRNATDNGDVTLILADASNNVVVGNAAELTLSSGAIVSNEAGADIDFRVESDTVDHALFVDGATGVVSIGKTTIESWSSVASVLQLGGNAAFSGTAAEGASGVLYWLQNAYYDTNDSRWEYISTDEASYISQTGGTTSINSAVSGTADAAITWVPQVDFAIGATVFNEGSANIDFRVETDSNAATLFIDGDVNAVAISRASILSWNTALCALQVGGNGAFSSNLTPGAGGTFGMYQNAYYDSVGYKYISTDEASIYYQSGGLHRFYSAPSGTADAAITFSSLLEMTVANTVFNEGGGDIDFRVESDDFLNALTVDGDKNVVAIAIADPETWGTGTNYGVLQIGGTGAMICETSQGASTRVQLIHNAYNDGAWKYRVTDEVEIISMVGGATTFYTAVAGTADNAITLIENMNMSYGSGMIINEGGDATQDVRVETDNYTYALFIDASENVVSLSGSATKKWHSSYAPLQIGGNNQIVATIAAGAGSAMYIDNNAYFDGAWKYISTDEATRLIIQGGNYSFAYAPSGTAGDAVTFVGCFDTGLSGTVFNDSSQDLDFRIETDGNNNMLTIDGALNVMRQGGASDYVETEADGDINFVGGGGLQFAEIYTHGSSATLTLNSGSGKQQVVSFTVNGLANGNVTPDHTNDHVTVGVAGYYEVTCAITIDNGAGASHTVTAGLWKNNGGTEFVNCSEDVSLPAGSSHATITLHGFVDCAANDTIELWATTDRATDSDVEFHDLTLTVKQIAGT